MVFALLPLMLVTGLLYLNYPAFPEPCWDLVACGRSRSRTMRSAYWAPRISSFMFTWRPSSNAGAVSDL